MLNKLIYTSFELGLPLALKVCAKKKKNNILEIHFRIASRRLVCMNCVETQCSKTHQGTLRSGQDLSVNPLPLAFLQGNLVCEISSQSADSHLFDVHAAVTSCPLM